MADASCSAGANPMAQMMKQFNQDRSLQRDRFDHTGPSMQQPHGMRSQQGRPMFQQDNMVNEFFGDEQGPAMRDPFQFTELQRELENVRHMRPGADWQAEFNQQGPRIWEIKPEEEAAMERAFQESRQAAGPNAAAWHREFMSHPEVQHMNPNQVAEFEQAFQRHFDWSSEFNAIDSKGKGPMISLANNAGWDEQFAAFDQPQQHQPQDLAEETDEAIAQKVEEAAAAQDDLGQLEDLWENFKEAMDDNDDWEEDFNNFSNSISGGPVYKPDLGEYVFEVVNPYLDNPDPLGEAMQLLNNGSSLSEAALAFEAAVRQDPMNSEAWMHLGNVQAQNEKEEPAIRALEKAISVDPANFPALMSLAVSYTNESYDQAAYQTLQQWITQRYPEVGSAAPSTINPFELHEYVTNLFLNAARQAPAQGMDPDVQVGLGVLFYGSGDLDKAVDCFVAALKGRPDDYLLWNRLGATLANNGRSEEAIDAYHKALELRPSFVRARYNLGVSCINIGCYNEAAEHLLTGLSMHKRMGNEEGVNVSSNLWEMLRKTFIMMDRRDLADKAVAGADINQFRNEFEF
ncbi:TPR-like protein [Hesseltinella vesiculosa]|uniref:TPR-like protein n=1 Tax=Hesseltinella vesiculosa TaxID=101127 RepID=A0A1X2GUG4_9FUNG|nr:TPR-like protein [Hesseltinella vesiculosa]